MVLLNNNWVGKWYHFLQSQIPVLKVYCKRLPEFALYTATSAIFWMAEVSKIYQLPKAFCIFKSLRK